MQVLTYPLRWFYNGRHRVADRLRIQLEAKKSMIRLRAASLRLKNS